MGCPEKAKKEERIAKLEEEVLELKELTNNQADLLQKLAKQVSECKQLCSLGQ
jgi:Mg2+ and Co2+ transporter CorA